MNTLDEIIKYIKSIARPVTANELSKELLKSRVSIHSALKRLVLEGAIQKQGRSPKVFYSLSDTSQSHSIKNQAKSFYFENDAIKKVIEENYFIITPDGNQLSGIEAFVYWCQSRGYDIGKKALEYHEVYNQYQSLRKYDTFDATEKVKTSFTAENCFLDKLYYLYPYSLPVFGRTKMAELLFNAKQNQELILMKQVFDIVVPAIESFIKNNEFDAICFTPPTVKRNVQFMKELQNKINTKLPIINIEKIKTKIIVQQKSLKDINERIENAEKTMVVNEKSKGYKKVLIIDDFTGSGATLNILAKKIKNQKISEYVVGLTITGSLKGFDVVREV